MIKFPETKEYGYIEKPDGTMYHKVTFKSIVSRIKYIINLRQAVAEVTTTGVKIFDSGKLTQEDLQLIEKEVKSLGNIEIPNDITSNKFGQEEPNFQIDDEVSENE